MIFATINTAMCEALGLDPTNITDVYIRLRPDQFPTVDVSYRVTAMDELCEVVKSYELRPAP